MTALRLLAETDPLPGSIPAAWFLPGGDPRRWLCDLATWRRSGSAPRLAVIPNSRHDPRPCGVLILDAMPPAPLAQAIPFVRRGRALYLPQAARVWPPVDDADLDALFPGEVVVWHPGTGLVAFATDDLLRPHDLLAAPELQRGRWTHAHPGERAARLVAIIAPVLPTVDELLDAGRGDITSRTPDTLPATNDEPGTAARGLHRLAWFLAAGVDRLARLAPHTASAPTWINGLEDWARRTMANNDPRLDDARHRELRRLLQQLNDDPDNGLRFALPLAGDAAHRGLAHPGTQLSQRSLDYSARSGGGLPLDPWAIDPALQIQLRARYLALAAREIALGRHRRAAYIHASLLGDLTSAASALEQGRYYREAAAIHLERLKQPLVAARILERGGLLDEAAQLFSDHGEHLAAAECHRRLGRPDAARECWRAAIATLLAAEDPLQAATVLTTHLEAPEEALALLAGTWPGHAQAGSCLAARFDLLGRLGRHGAAADLVDRLAQDEHGREDLALDALIQVVAAYPDAHLGPHAGDAGRLLIARKLAAGKPAGQLLKRMHGLAAGDQLLASDASRWSRRSLPGQPKARPAILAPRAPIAFRLAPDIEWLTAVATQLGLVAVGSMGSLGLIVIRATWAGSADSLRWPDDRHDEVLCFPLTDGRVYLRTREPSGWTPLTLRSKAANDTWGAILNVGTFGPLHGTVAAAAADHDGGWRMLSDGADG